MAAAGVAGHHDIFRSVFPPADYTTPTPENTPNIGVLSPGRPFGGFNAPANFADETARADRAWSTATRYLSLQSRSSWPAPQQNELQAFDLLLGLPERAPLLVDWYLNQVGLHFRQRVLPSLQAWQRSVPVSGANDLINSTVQALGNSQEHYLQPIDGIASAVRRGALVDKINGLRHQVLRKWHALALNSLPRQRVQKTLASALYQHMKASLERHSNPEKCLKDGRCHCRIDFRGLPLYLLQEVGLGGDIAQRALALATHRLLEGAAVERRCFQVDWSGLQTVVPRLKLWVEEQFAPAVQEAIALLIGERFEFSAIEVQRMASTAALSLVRKRTDALFDYVKMWPYSTGALLDIKENLMGGTPSEKAALCAAFARQFQHRLLHAGATTVEVLSMYVNTIHAFKLLDARGVLLEKVAIPIRAYLRTRDDTVSIIAASFLADLDANGNLANDSHDNVCVDVAREVATSSLEDTRDHKTLNWDDMNWMPEPIDGGSNHKYAKSEDVLSYIMGLFDQEEFIKEITSVLAQHLLQSTDPDFAKETRLVELFKSRFDPSKLQAAEVMLKDMRDSVMFEKRIFPGQYRAPIPTPREIQAAMPHEGISLSALTSMFMGRIQEPQLIASLKLIATRRNNLYYPKRSRLPRGLDEGSKRPGQEMTVNLRILSNFFWPQLRSNKFLLPIDFGPVLERTHQQFSRYSGQRILEWQNALGRMSVTLELEDRMINEEDIPAWRASVIYAFATDRTDNMAAYTPPDYDPEAGLTAEQLQEKLQMEEELVSDALSYWMTKRVLYQPTEPGVYHVLERLDMDTGLALTAAQQAANDAAFSAIKSQDAVLRENAPMFQTFIANMLRNGGAKEVGGMMGITNMLKMVLPTFTYGDEETLVMLGEMEERGEVVRSGETWAIAK